MSKIIKIAGEEVSIGMDNGSIKNVKKSDLSFSPNVNDEVEVYENGNSIIVNKKECKNTNTPININVSNQNGPQIEPKTFTYGGVASWIFGILLIIAGLGAISSSPVSGILYLIGGAFILPPVTKLMYEKTNFKITKGLKVAIFFVIIIAASMFMNTTSTDTQSKESSTNKVEKEPEVIYNVGDEFTTDKFAITITKVEERTKVGSTYFSTNPSEGAVYICVQYKYKNITDKPISGFDSPSFRLVDENGVKYDADINGSSYYATEVDVTSKVLSDLNPLITVTGSTVFEVSKELYDSKNWTINLLSKPYTKVAISK